ncbi:MAG: pilus assembly protein [Actinobacteria bacterium]|nr:pilus assembly protein [Actinomycetota bacterium]
MNYISLKSQEGNILIELSLVTPILLLMLAGIVQFGFILNAKVAVNAASYEAARVATLADDPVREALDSVKDYASSTLPGWDFSRRLKARVVVSGNNPGDLVSVEVIYMVPVFFSRILPVGREWDGYIHVSGSSVMSIEEKE